MRIVKLLLTVASLLTGAWAFAQQGTIRGRVTDESREPIIGVLISISNTSRGTATDRDGKFEILAGRRDTLVFSSLGFVPQRIAVGSRTNFEVTLEQDTQVIDEVVVVGYGVTKLREELTYQQGFLATVMKKLSNERFVASAPPAVVAAEQTKRADAEARISALMQRIDAI